MRRLLLIVAFLGVCAVPAAAAVLEGVTMADSVPVGDNTLQLNGMGVRIKKVAIVKVKVYVAGLYVQARSGDGDAIAAADEPKRLVMHFLYKQVERAKLIEAWNEGFAANAGEQLAALEERIASFNAMWPDMKAGEVASLTYVPGTGTLVEIQGAGKGIIPGADFARALFSIWLGAKPPNPELKAGLLGK